MKLKTLFMSSGASDNTCFNLMLSNSSDISECSFSKQINLVQNEQFSFFINSWLQKNKCVNTQHNLINNKWYS